MLKFKRSIVWLRRDLRLSDHKALSESTKNSEAVFVVFIFDTEILKHLTNKNDLRLSFIHESLQEIDNELRKKGSQLIVRIGDPVNEIPKLMVELGAEALFFNEDYEPYAKKRDSEIQKKLQNLKIPSYAHKDQVIFSGDEILKSNGEPYQMFSPYKNQWLRSVTKENYQVQKVGENFASLRHLKNFPSLPSLQELGFEKMKFYYRFQNPGRRNALIGLNEFQDLIRDYNKNRDFPHLDGTSGLSVHLRFGTISVRECVSLCMQSNSEGHRTWLYEIIWREFYQMILHQFPHVTKKNFKKKYSQIQWPGSLRNFNKWCAAQTGYPIVDAAMRQLNETGWMHNRLRMIVASFLTKDLLVDWRKGEAYFAEKLLDYDMASNNGGWQWSASTGCDAQPYFRIFNPELQSRKFDPKGEFLRKWLPELKNCSNAEIHCPHGVVNYPRRIVDHQYQKLLAIEMFKSLGSSGY